MYAVIESGGKQYRVSPGDVIKVETLPAEVGSQGNMKHVIAVSTDDGKILTGDKLSNAAVEATILGNGRAKKIIVFHLKRKKQYKKTQGHRQNYTELRVDKITI
jgi:large subunit ribosomal protein L21